MRRLFVFAFIITLIISPISTFALSFVDVNGVNNINLLVDTKNATNNGVLNSDPTAKYNQPQDCDSLFGDPNKPESVAWLLQKIFDIAKVVGSLLVVVLSSIDFAQVVVKSDDDEMAKAKKKLITRLILAAAIFFVPTITMVLLEVFGITSDPTCGIQ